MRGARLPFSSLVCAMLAVWDIALAADRAGLAPRETAESVGMLLGAGHLVESAVGLRKAPRSASARSAA